MKLVAIKYQPSTRGDLIVKCCIVNLFWLCPFSTLSHTLAAKAVVVGGLRIMPTSHFITAALHIPAASKPQGYYIHYLFQRHVFYILGWKVIRIPDTTVFYLECNHEKYMAKTKKDILHPSPNWFKLQRPASAFPGHRNYQEDTNCMFSDLLIKTAWQGVESRVFCFSDVLVLWMSSVSRSSRATTWS